MAISITVITTSGRARRFLQTDPAASEHILGAVRRSGQLFTGRPLILGSAAQIEVFAPSAIACIEFETRHDLSSYLPSTGNLTLTALRGEQLDSPFVGSTDGEHLSVRIDFFLAGGYVLHVHAESTRGPGAAERVLGLASLFERPAIGYRLSHGGGGLLNPQALLRIVVTPGFADLPRETWLAESAGT